MKKIFKIIMFFVMLLVFNILNVDAKEIHNIDELNDCLTFGGTCKLINNIVNSSDSVKVISSTDVTLDLNGYSIINYNFVINDGKFTLDDSIGGGIIDTFAKKGFEVNDSILVINDGKIIASEVAIYSQKAQVTINAGEFVGRRYEENQSGTNGMAIFGGNVIINGGKFMGMQDSEHYGANGLLVSSNGGIPNVIINGGFFYGVDQGIKVEGGIVEINAGIFEGDKYGIWISNSYINKKHITTINGGEFKGGSTGIRISGDNKNIIKGGVYTGSVKGMDINCANPIRENCKTSVLLSGGVFISLNTVVNYSYSTAIFMNSDSNLPVKISDLLAYGYEFSNNNLLEKDGGVYGYYSYMESLTVSVSRYFDVDESITVDSENNYFSGIELNSSAKSVLNKIDTPGEVVIRNNDREIIRGNDFIGTGSVISIISSIKKYDYAVIITGDIDGDGVLKLSDIMKTANYIYKNKNSLTGVYELAADFDNNGVYNLQDIMKIAKTLYSKN